MSGGEVVGLASEFVKYFEANGVTYSAGALEPPANPTAATLSPHYQRFKFQLISMGPDGWTPGLDPTPSAQGFKYYNITLALNPYVPPRNPALVGTDDVLVAPVKAPLLGHPDGTADDINNWNK